MPNIEQLAYRLVFQNIAGDELFVTHALQVPPVGSIISFERDETRGTVNVNFGVELTVASVSVSYKEVWDVDRFVYRHSALITVKKLRI